MSSGQANEPPRRHGWTTAPGADAVEKPGHRYLGDAGGSISGEKAGPRAIGALCGLRNSTGLPQAQSQHFWICEFVELVSGEKLALNDSRGFTLGGRGFYADDADRKSPISRELLERTIVALISPDPDDPNHDAVRRLAALASDRGVDLDERDLRSLRYQVILTDEVLVWLDNG